MLITHTTNLYISLSSPQKPCYSTKVKRKGNFSAVQGKSWFYLKAKSNTTNNSSLKNITFFEHAHVYIATFHHYQTRKLCQDIVFSNIVKVSCESSLNPVHKSLRYTAKYWFMPHLPMENNVQFTKNGCFQNFINLSLAHRHSPSIMSSVFNICSQLSQMQATLHKSLIMSVCDFGNLQINLLSD